MLYSISSWGLPAGVKCRVRKVQAEAFNMKWLACAKKQLIIEQDFLCFKNTVFPIKSVFQ